MLDGMKYLPFDHLAAASFLSSLWRPVRQRMAGLFPKRPAIAVPGAGRRLILAWVLITLGVMVQLVLLWLVGELVDLVFSLMELWAELAAKHLRITLDNAS
jgi:hypothetical protein